MSKNRNKTNVDLEEALSNFISEISNDPNKNTDLIAKKFLTQLENKFNFPKKDIVSIFSHLEGISHNHLIYINKIPFISFCEHHMFPFFGEVSIAVLPQKNILGVSKFSDLINNLSSKLTLQEKLTEEIAEEILENLDPQGVYVKVKAKHLCSDLLSPENSIGDITTTFANGIYELDSSLRAEAALNMS